MIEADVLNDIQLALNNNWTAYSDERRKTLISVLRHQSFAGAAKELGKNFETIRKHVMMTIGKKMGVAA
jgi:hypothetical protein